MKPLYSPENLVAIHAQYRTLCIDVSACPLIEVRNLWQSAVINGLDTCDDLQNLRIQWGMPKLTNADVEAIISISSACGLVPERMYDHRTRTWFANRSIVG